MLSVIINKGDYKMNNTKINKIVKNREMVDILMRIFDFDDNENNNLHRFDIRNSDQVDRFVNALCDYKDDDDIRIYLSQDQMDNDSDTWRGINRCFGISKTQISKLKRKGVVTGAFFDDGTLHVGINPSRACSVIQDAMPCDDVQTIIDNLKNDMNNAQRIIDGLLPTNNRHC